jgi:hypothetical protein
VSWQAAILILLAVVLISGGVWFERSRPTARILAAVAALAALGAAGRVALAPLPNVVATTDVTLLAGYTLGGAPGFAVGALSALASNFWLGQGPWTPWQMAGWGMVGVGGAVLARLSGRRLGRFGLAAAAGLAGLLYGALLDLSVMVNFGGEQSLERYLALSARGVPFNVAHAAGNAALMLAAGPTLVRMLDRYRERFEVRWRAAPAGTVAAVAAAALIAVPMLSPPAPSAEAAAAAAEERASGAGEERSGRAAEAVVAAMGDARGWLRKTQNRDGGWGISRGSSSNPGMTGWAMLGLEAAGLNPLDVRRGGRTPVDYLRRNIGALSSTGDLERTIIALRGAGVPAKRFGGRDLVAELRSRQGDNGSYERQVNLTAFAILARAAAGEGTGSLRRPAGWLRGAQNRDGGWGSTHGAASEPDSTGASLQALALLGANRPLRAGAGWLRRAQHGDGGWSLTPGGGSNAQSTAWAMQGLIAAGVDPGRVRKRSRSGFDYLRSRQARDGHYAYSKSSDQTPVWVTAQALAAVARQPFPIAPVARRPRAGRGPAGAGGGSGSAAGGRAGGRYGDGGGFGGAARGGGGRAGGGGAGKAERRSERGPGGRGGRAGGAELFADAGRSAPAAAKADDDEQQGGSDSVPAEAGWFGIANLAGAGLLGGWLLYRRRFG